MLLTILLKQSSATSSRNITQCQATSKVHHPGTLRIVLGNSRQDREIMHHSRLLLTKIPHASVLLLPLSSTPSPSTFLSAPTLHTCPHYKITQMQAERLCGSVFPQPPLYCPGTVPSLPTFYLITADNGIEEVWQACLAYHLLVKGGSAGACRQRNRQPLLLEES